MLPGEQHHHHHHHQQDEEKEDCGVTGGGDVLHDDEGSLLVVGNYCHDVLFRDGLLVGEGIGGAASFVSNVLDPLLLPQPHRRGGISHLYVSKVGPDFAYAASRHHHPPLVSATASTTLFHAYFSSSSDDGRVLKRVRSCDTILPSDLPASRRFRFGLAVGVAGEIPPETLARMLDLCGVVFVDAQALIRAFDPSDGTVGLIPLKDSGFSHLLRRIGFLKASAEEAPFLDIEEARKCCCVIVTQGKDGCRLYWKDGESVVLPFPAIEVDPTGAGDSFLGGVVAGLTMGLGVHESALLGNFFGSLTVSQIGVPKFYSRVMQKVRQELRRYANLGCESLGSNDVLKFQKSDMHEEFRAFLLEVAKLQQIPNPSDLVAADDKPQLTSPADLLEK